MGIRFAIVSASIALSTVALVLAFALGATVSATEGLDSWLSRYQNLVASLIAIGAACIAAWPVWRQLKENNRQTEVLSYQALLDIFLRLKQCEQAAWNARQAALYFVLLEEQTVKVDRRSVVMLDGLLSISNSLIPDMDAAIETIGEKEAQRARVTSQASLLALTAFSKLNEEMTIYRHRIQMLATSERDNPSEERWNRELAALKTISLSPLVKDAVAKVDGYIAELQADLNKAVFRIGRFTFLD